MYLKTIESVNHIYGRAMNPWNLGRTPGGSSGGESSLVASYCSPGGFGGDIGGSVRTPCCYTNLWGIKPSSKRITYLGGAISTETGRLGQDLILPVCGPLARSPECVIRMFKTINDPDQSFDDTLLDYVPWDEAEFTNKKPLRIGFLTSIDSIFKTCKSQKRAVDEAVDLAKKCGHILVPIDYDFGEFYRAFLSVLGHGNKAQELMNELQGEKIIDEYKLFIMRNKIPLVVLKLLGKLMNRDPTRFNMMMDSTASKTVRELAEAYHFVDQCK